MKKIFSIILTLCFFMILMSGCNMQKDVDQKLEDEIEKDVKIEAVTLEVETMIEEYDITNDGKQDTLYIRCEEPVEADAWGIFGYCWEFAVNDKSALKVETESDTMVEAELYQINEERNYLAVKYCLRNNDDIEDYVLYQYMDGELQEVCDFYCDNINVEHIFHYGAEISSVTANQIVLRCRNQFNATAYITWMMEFYYQDGQWNVNGNEYSVEYEEYQADKADGLTANQELTIYTTTDCRSVAYMVPEGEVVTIDKICIEEGEIYFHTTNRDGQEGWLKDPEEVYYTMDGDYGYFEEALFAG